MYLLTGWSPHPIDAETAAAHGSVPATSQPLR
jgi:hypothetical protein